MINDYALENYVYGGAQTWQHIESSQDPGRLLTRAKTLLDMAKNDKVTMALRITRVVYTGFYDHVTTSGYEQGLEELGQPA